MFRYGWQWVWLVLLSAPVTVWASDMAREQRMAEQIEEAIMVGEAIRLRADGVEFFAIHAEADSEPRLGAVLLLHGMGAHPDWADIINPLRSELPEAGWETLSIQLPVAAAGAGYRDYWALFPEARGRIAAALAFLRERGDGPIFLVGHSLGSSMAVNYLAHRGDGEIPVAGLVVVGLSANAQRPDSGTLGALKRIQEPVLDLYGSEDMAAVRDSAAARVQAATAGGNGAYRQREVDGADHFFHDRDGELMEAVGAWLQQPRGD